VKPQTKNCRDCGYDLGELTTNRCPECGRAFDLTDPKTFATNNPRGRPLRLGIGYLVVACLGLIVLIWFLVTYQSIDALYLPEWAGLQLRFWRAAQWAEFGVLVVAAVQSRRNRYSWMGRAGMWVAALTLAGLWGMYLVVAILWSL
jgi:hypothetical protein